MALEPEQRTDIERALSAPWEHLRHQASAISEDVRIKELHHLEDAGRNEDRVRQEDTGRYPMELLQNAHDACADASHLALCSSSLLTTRFLWQTKACRSQRTVSPPSFVMGLLQQLLMLLPVETGDPTQRAEPERPLGTDRYRPDIVSG